MLKLAYLWRYLAVATKRSIPRGQTIKLMIEANRAHMCTHREFSGAGVCSNLYVDLYLFKSQQATIQQPRIGIPLMQD